MLHAEAFQNRAVAGPPRVSAEIGPQLGGVVPAFAEGGVPRMCNDFGRANLKGITAASLQNLSFHFLGLQVLGACLP
jgi:hypothetical protein